MSLKIGDKIPKFKATASNGEVFNSETVIGIQPVIIYFYPKDNTPGCTAQACGFRDHYEKFTDLGIEVIGISSDSVASHKGFSNKYKLPFILLSDSDKKLRTLFGVKTNLFGLIPGRVTYVVDKMGTIKLIFDNINALKHISKTIEMVKKL